MKREGSRLRNALRESIILAEGVSGWGDLATGGSLLSDYHT
jgi:hypothetical protein